MSTLLFTMGAVIYAASVGVALLNAFAFLALQGALAIYYGFDPLSRRVRLAPVAPDEPDDADQNAELKPNQNGEQDEQA